MTMIRFEEVHKSYGGVHALRGVDIEVREGEFTVLIGPSGCGKTTALKMVNRLITPTKGRVLVGGKDVAQLDAVQLRRDIGYVIQETGLFPHMTIAENIALVPRLKKWPKSRRDQRVDELLHLVGLDPDEYRHRYPRHLSGGQRQRVGVARALAADPPIILMDEPFGATDPITRKQLQRELVRIKQQVKKTILFVTHDISEAFVLADSICLLRSGRVVQHDTPEGLIRRPAEPFVTEFIGDEALLHELEYLRAGEVGESRIVTLPDTSSVQQALQAFSNSGIKAVCLVDENGRLTGVITRRDLAVAGLDHAGGTGPSSGKAARASNNGALETPARELATLDPPHIRHDELVRESFPRLIHPGRDNADAGDYLVVVDGNRRPRGLIGYEDLVRLIARLSKGAPEGGFSPSSADGQAHPARRTAGPGDGASFEVTAGGSQRDARSALKEERSA